MGVLMLYLNTSLYYSIGIPDSNSLLVHWCKNQKWIASDHHCISSKKSRFKDYLSI